MNFSAFRKLFEFFCDFYIEDIDTWIEFNGFMTHGGHPFDENNLDDINKLNIWKTKNNSFYIQKCTGRKNILRCILFFYSPRFQC